MQVVLTITPGGAFALDFPDHRPHGPPFVPFAHLLTGTLGARVARPPIEDVEDTLLHLALPDGVEVVLRHSAWVGTSLSAGADAASGEAMRRLRDALEAHELPTAPLPDLPLELRALGWPRDDADPGE